MSPRLAAIGVNNRFTKKTNAQVCMADESRDLETGYVQNCCEEH